MPRDLRDLDRWVRHSPSKVPLRADGVTAASSTDSSTWSPYEAVRACDRRGFVLNGDGIYCLDLDHCLVEGRPLLHVAELLARLPATYTEVSPSGDGLHVWLRGPLARDGVNRILGVRLEAYSRGRYVTITGRKFGDCPSVIATW